jgi:autotransporter strand-loop-strand O-heptosyltransferase
MLTYNIHHVNGLYFELTADGGKNRQYEVSVIDRDTSDTVYKSTISNGGWIRLNRRYLSNLAVIIRFEGRTIEQINFLDRIKGKRVMISFDSKALGDTIAWMPYCLEFARHYQCKVIVSTFKNFLFEKAYPELEFVGRGVVVNDLIAMFEIGWFWDTNKEPVNPILIPLQQSASNILHLPHREIQPLIDYYPSERPFAEKYVCISIYSTSQCKLWYHWQETIDFLRERGYRVVEVSKESDMMGVKTSEFDGLEEMGDKSMESLMTHLHHCDFFIGLSSGISWLAYAMRKRVYMISNFTNPEHEFTFNTVRISDHSVCNSCWNDPAFRFNKGDWRWCPRHEDTPRHFECHKKIPALALTHKITENEKL